MTNQTIRLTMAQAIVRYLENQRVEIDGHTLPFFGGCWAIFGHGNVAGLGEALAESRMPTHRAHNEQAMAHSAIAYAKASARRRAMICTTSIGPGATNMITAAALAHVNRLPVLFLPGDVFANRRPDPVLQQIEDFDDGTISANDCFRPVSRYFDRLSRPEHILNALPRMMATFMDPARCGPVTLAACQDTQAESFDYPTHFFAPRTWTPITYAPHDRDIAALAEALAASHAPLIIAGGGVNYSGAGQALADFCARHSVPVAETQAGKGTLPASHPCNLGAIGVTGTAAANSAAAEADLVLAIGTRLQDFTTGSRSLFGAAETRLYAINVASHDAFKHSANALLADAALALDALEKRLGDYATEPQWQNRYAADLAQWRASVDALPRAVPGHRPSDGEVVLAVNRALPAHSVPVAAAGGLPGDLHRFWQVAPGGAYHCEYGFSCMGYEIAAGIGVRLARPDLAVTVMVGDGSYMMMNSEIATAAAMGLSLTIVLLDNRGFGCINRLQAKTGGRAFNNLLRDCPGQDEVAIDFVAHAAAMGAKAAKVESIAALEQAVRRATDEGGVQLVLIETDPAGTPPLGGWWWDVAVPEVSSRPEVTRARADYERDRANQQLF